MPQVKAFLDNIFSPRFDIGGLHNLVQRCRRWSHATPEPGSSASSSSRIAATAILLTAIISGFIMGFSPARMVAVYLQTFRVTQYSTITISAMVALATLTRFAGVDATLGIGVRCKRRALSVFRHHAGLARVATTGSDTASNLLFGNLQRITSEQLGLSPIFDGSGEFLGRCDGQDDRRAIHRVASTATGWVGHESSILRFVFVHSIVLAMLVGILVTLQAYVYPFHRDGRALSLRLLCRRGLRFGRGHRLFGKLPLRVHQEGGERA